MVNLFVAITDRSWFELLSQEWPDEVIFWQPSGSRSFGAVSVGELFLFKLHAPDVYGPIRLPGFPVTLSETPARIHRQAPQFGEHTEEVLIEMLGMDWAEVTALCDPVSMNVWG